MRRDLPLVNDVNKPAAPQAAAAAAAPSRWTALDGLRGIMTVCVFIAHVNYDWLPGPILFMDTFFMMSSFLITRLLLKDWHRAGTLHIRQFYLRRVRRLYPALLLVIAATTAMTYFYYGRGVDQMLHVAGALFYFSNWLRALAIPHDPVLGHTWSLSIEEQFYLVWPLLLWLCLRLRCDGRRLFFLLLGVAVAAAAWRAELAAQGAPIFRTYNGTDMRLDSLALGAMLAIGFDWPLMRRCAAWVSRFWVMWPLVGLLGYGAALVDFRTPQWYIWQQPLYCLASLALILGLLENSRGGLLNYLLQNPLAVYLGTICYGVYLWHFPVLWILSDIFKLSDWDKVLICGPITLACASISYFFIERPLLRIK